MKTILYIYFNYINTSELSCFKNNRVSQICSCELQSPQRCMCCIANYARYMTTMLCLLYILQYCHVFGTIENMFENVYIVQIETYTTSTVLIVFRPTSKPGKVFDNVPCSVCHVSEGRVELMIPARKTCPGGWMRDYGGYLATSHRFKHRSTFACTRNHRAGRRWGGGE